MKRLYLVTCNRNKEMKYKPFKRYNKVITHCTESVAHKFSVMGLKKVDNS